MTATQLKLALIAKRKANRMTYRAAGEQSGVNFMTIRRIEKGQAFDYETGVKVINWLNPPDAPDTVATVSAAIFADARLSERQKVWMVDAFAEVYEVLVEKGEKK